MQDKTQTLKEYLAGMKHSNPAALKQLTVIENWSEMAGREVQRRASYFLENLPTDLLTAIARGEVDVKRAIADALFR